MKDYREFFKNKKVTVIGLGLLGGSLGDIEFLLKYGAKVTVTDLKNAKELKASLGKLNKFVSLYKKENSIRYVLGKHDLKDFREADMILQPGNVPEDSPFLIEARKRKIPVYVSESLFAKCVPNINMIGVTGTRGKSMTTALIYKIFSENKKFLSCPSTLFKTEKPSVFLGGNVRNVSTLALLEKVKTGDIVVMELDSWALHGMGDIKKSPQISVFTSFMPDHMNFYGWDMTYYFEDKANIFKYQKKGDTLIIRPHVKKLITRKIKSKLIIADVEKVSDYKFIVPGEHQRENLATAVEVAKLFNIPEIKIKNSVKNFKGLEGRLQYLKTIRGVKIYNDNNATTPEASIAGIKALFQEGKEEKIVLICGGADKNLNLKLFVTIVNTFCKAVVMIPGSGTKKLNKFKFKIGNYNVENLQKAVKKAVGIAKKGDIILFSPAFASFGQFNNEYERNDLFVKIVKSLK